MMDMAAHAIFQECNEDSDATVVKDTALLGSTATWAIRQIGDF